MDVSLDSLFISSSTVCVALISFDFERKIILFTTKSPTSFNFCHSDDFNRVCLHQLRGNEGSDYVNASFIDVSNMCIQIEVLVLHVISLAEKISNPWPGF